MKDVLKLIAILAGIPTIIRPFFGDQFFWADRVEALGVGSGVRKLTTASLTEALITAAHDQKQVDRARLIGEQIRSVSQAFMPCFYKPIFTRCVVQENGVATAIESIYRDLEYARSLIKHTPVEDSGDDANNEHSTTRNPDLFPNSFSPSSYHGYDSVDSMRRPPSEDWSVISDMEHPNKERQSSVGSQFNEGKGIKDSPSKQKSITATVLSVLPSSLTSASLRTRTHSGSSRH